MLQKINEIKNLLDGLSATGNFKIGIGITTHNRPQFLKQCLENIKKHTPEAYIVVVDDASKEPVTEATYRFENNVGIARAKNKCLELLYKADCDYLFLFDDDTWALQDEWYLPYINSGEPHLMYIFQDFAGGNGLNDTAVLYKDSKITAYSHARGCMLYITRECLDKVGGMDEEFGRWGYEHPAWSDRIFNSGFTSFKYMDVSNSKGLFYSDDEQQHNKNTTVTGLERQGLVQKNKDLYDQKKFDSHFIPFYEKENIFLTCYFTGVPDPQGRTFESDINQLLPLIDSAKNTGCKLVILHDCFTEIDLEGIGAHVTFERVETSINPYIQRWVSYRSYLKANEKFINKCFCVDGTDVEILKSPNWESMDGLYCGDEPDLLDDKSGWMRKHHLHPELTRFFDEKGNTYQLLNAGVLGGPVDILLDFMKSLIDFYCTAEHEAYSMKTPNAGSTDMGLFNYVARNIYGHMLKYGREITTTFKANERNTYTWIKHK